MIVPFGGVAVLAGGVVTAAVIARVAGAGADQARLGRGITGPGNVVSQGLLDA